MAQPLNVLLQRGLLTVFHEPHARELVAHDTQARLRRPWLPHYRRSKRKFMARDLNAVQPAALAISLNGRLRPEEHLGLRHEAHEQPQQPLCRRVRRAAEHVEQREHWRLVVALKVTSHGVDAPDSAHGCSVATAIELNVQCEAVVPLFSVDRFHALASMDFLIVARLQRGRHAIAP